MPDLRLRHKLEFAEVGYFIECKYRSSLPNGKLYLSDQLSRYRRLVSEYDNHELFIALGIGGSPNNPAEFYVIPSRMVKHDSIINIKNFSKCLCTPDAEAFHTYIENFYRKRVYKM